MVFDIDNTTIARIEDGKLWLDVRTIADDEVADVVDAVRRVLA